MEIEKGNRQYKIPGTDFVAFRYDDSQAVYDAARGISEAVPFVWDEPELCSWAKGYDAGIEKGKHEGRLNAQKDIQKAFGIYDLINKY